MVVGVVATSIARWEAGSLSARSAETAGLVPTTLDVVGITLDGATTAGHAEDASSDWRYGFTEDDSVVTNEAPPGSALLCGGRIPPVTESI